MPRPRLAPALSLAERRRLSERLDQLRYLREQVDAELRLIERRLNAKPKGRTPRKELEHGTDSGYLWHLRHKVEFPEDTGGEPCGCREAHRVYVSSLRPKRWRVV